MRYRILYDDVFYDGNKWFFDLYPDEPVHSDFATRINKLINDGHELQGNLIGAGNLFAQAFMVNEDG